MDGSELLPHKEDGWEVANGLQRERGGEQQGEGGRNVWLPTLPQTEWQMRVWIFSTVGTVSAPACTTLLKPQLLTLMVKIMEAGNILYLNRIFLCNGHCSMLDDFTIKQCLIHLLRRSCLVKKKKKKQQRHLDPTQIKFLKEDGSSDVQGCSTGASMVACEGHMCEHVWVYMQQRLHQCIGVISASTCVKLRPNNGFSPSKRNQWTLSSAYWSLITFWMSEHMTAERRNPLSL